MWKPHENDEHGKPCRAMLTVTTITPLVRHASKFGFLKENIDIEITAIKRKTPELSGVLRQHK
jgi:hypothetical protein